MSKLVDGWYSERAGARRDAGALGPLRHARCSCSRPRAATPRRSSASTSSTRARRLLDAGRVKLYSSTASTGGRCSPREGDAGRAGVAADRSSSSTSATRWCPAIRADCSLRRHRDASPPARRSARSTPLAVRVPLPRRVPRRHRHERHVRPAPVLRRAGGRRLRRHRRRSQFLPRLGRARTWSCSVGASWCWPAARAPTRTSASRGAMAARARRQGVPNRVDPWGPEWPHDWPTVAGDVAALPRRAGWKADPVGQQTAGERDRSPDGDPLDAPRPAGA